MLSRHCVTAQECLLRLTQPRASRAPCLPPRSVAQMPDKSTFTLVHAQRHSTLRSLLVYSIHQKKQKAPQLESSAGDSLFALFHSLQDLSLLVTLDLAFQITLVSKITKSFVLRGFVSRYLSSTPPLQISTVESPPQSGIFAYPRRSPPRPIKKALVSLSELAVNNDINGRRSCLAGWKSEKGLQ